MIPIFVYIIFFAISWVFKRIFWRIDSGRFHILRMTIGLVGVTVHELSHLVGCLFVGKKPIKLMIRSTHGRVSIKRISFAEGFIVSLAPLVVSLWLLDWALALFFAPTTDFLLGLVLIFFMVSLFLGGAPSNPDLRIIISSFSENRAKNMAIFGVILACFVISAIIFYTFELFYLHDVFFLLTVIILYHVFKLSWLAANGVIYLIKNHHFTKKARYKPKYVYDTPIEERGEVI